MPFGLPACLVKPPTSAGEFGPPCGRLTEPLRRSSDPIGTAFPITRAMPLPRFARERHDRGGRPLYAGARVLGRRVCSKSPLPVWPKNAVSTTVSAFVCYGASTEDSLSFTRPVFPLPGLAAVDAAGLGLSTQLRTLLPRGTATHVVVGTGVSTLPEFHDAISLNSLSFPLVRPRVARRVGRRPRGPLPPSEPCWHHFDAHGSSKLHRLFQLAGHGPERKLLRRLLQSPVQCAQATGRALSPLRSPRVELLVTV